MGETTSHKDEVSREEAADLLQAIARELETDGAADIRVGNKLLTLAPGNTLEYAIEVEERSPMLGGEREEVTVSLGWEEATTDAEQERPPDEEDDDLL
ncbi:amphi-Trp domain-containing protein [Natrialbaceae archaeon A-arb3/5]